MTGCCAKCGPIPADEVIMHLTQCLGAQQWPDGGLAVLDLEGAAREFFALINPSVWGRVRAWFKIRFS
jgi:hypothetical protein